MNNVAGKAYNYEFKMFMEGVEIPFKSATVICTPNGVEFNINVHVCKELYDLKPKTSVQIFFREWYDPQKAWRLMADGFFSGFVSGEDSTGGRSVGITCRDFRMDIRKSPAALSWAAKDEIDTQTLYSVEGIFQNIVTRSKTVKTRTYDNSGLMDLEIMVGRIAGTAYGTPAGNDGGNAYNTYNFSTTEVYDKKSNKPLANGGLFLDAFIRGIWMEAVGGTTANSFLNKRIRADKRFLVPRNFAGYNFWMRNHFGLEIGSAVMGGSRFSSLEAAMMNVAGMFSVRVYSCSTPSLISLNKKEDLGQLEFVMDETVRQYVVEKGANEFGAPYMLNQCMLLPPMEFTSPPNCNLFFPPMYDKINWQHDDDADITRGYFDVISSLNTPGGLDLGTIKFQIPNALFHVTKGKTAATKKRLPLTLEERYKGVNVLHGSVEYNLAAADVGMLTNKDGKKNRENKEAEVIQANNFVTKAAPKPAESNAFPSLFSEDTQKQIDLASEKSAKEQAASKPTSFGDEVMTAYKRHAMIKYLNSKYAGRVVSVDMAFNPFVMCGFPGAIISTLEEMNTNVTKTIIGMVQQVSHTIYITQGGADAATSVIMNNVRFEDEPTDLDADGLPLYIQPSDPDKDHSEIILSTLEFKEPTKYTVPDPMSPVEANKDGKEFDLNELEIGGNGYRFVKDFLTTAANMQDENIYLDKSYEPNRIFKFYDSVFGHTRRHFMIGSRNGKYFAYNSMHEAFVELRKTRPELLTDYSACMDYVRRNICSADAFYHGILGLSSSGDIPVTAYPEDPYSPGITTLTSGFINRTSGFIDNYIATEYWGISSEEFTNKQPYYMQDLHMESAGMFSSIREHLPITAFIAERRFAVNDYKAAAIRSATGVIFNGR